jgi:hypothetical protein
MIRRSKGGILGRKSSLLICFDSARRGHVGRLGRQGEIGYASLFFLSAESAYEIAQHLAMDNGMMGM